MDVRSSAHLPCPDRPRAGHRRRRLLGGPRCNTHARACHRPSPRSPSPPSPRPRSPRSSRRRPLASRSTLTDDEGSSATIPAEPTKIVSLTPAATETLFALGVGDRIVGKVEDFSPYPPEAAAGIPDVAKFGSVDVEKIVALGTDLVIAGGNNFNPPEVHRAAARRWASQSWWSSRPTSRWRSGGHRADRSRRRAGPTRRPRSTRRSSRRSTTSGRGRAGKTRRPRLLRARCVGRLLRSGTGLLRHRDDQGRRRRSADERHGRRLPDRGQSRSSPSTRRSSCSATRPTA